MERYALEPDFRLGIIGAGLFTKAQAIEEIEQQSDLGRLLLRAEMGYINELVAQLAAGLKPEWPPMPYCPLPCSRLAPPAALGSPN